MRIYLWAGVMASALFLPAASPAKDKAPPPPPQAWQEMVKCRAIAEPTARLACFDAQVAKLEQAASNGDLVLADRESVRKTKRGLFGFSVSLGGLFGGGDEKNSDEVSEIDTTIASARQFGYGSWRITMADGSVWEQSDETKLVFDPRSGDKIHIYKGTLGVYRANIAGQRAIKIRRIQ